MFAHFHVCGVMSLFSAMLYMLVRYVSLIGHMCMMILVFTLCGVVFALFYCLFDSCCGCVIVVSCSLCVLFVTVFVNCLLSVLAICVGEVTVFSLKVYIILMLCLSFFYYAVYCLPKVCMLCF